MNSTPTSNEVEILSRVIAPEEPMLPLDAAQMFLTFDFRKEDRERMSELAEKAREGVLTAEEQTEIDCYERVGHFLSLLRSKARLSLQQAKLKASS